MYVRRDNGKQILNPTFCGKDWVVKCTDDCVLLYIRSRSKTAEYSLKRARLLLRASKLKVTLPHEGAVICEESTVFDGRLLQAVVMPVSIVEPVPMGVRVNYQAEIPIL